MLNSNKPFWADEDNWQEDAYGYVFLARALHIVGASLYGEAWTRREPLTPPLFDIWNEIGGFKGLKSRNSIGFSTEVELLELLRKHAPDKVVLEDEEGLQPLVTLQTLKRYGPSSLGSPRIKKVMTAETYRAAVEIAEEENGRRKAAQERLADAQNVLKTAMRDKKLAYVLLPLLGGSFSDPMPPEWWNVKDVRWRFTACRMSIDNPLTPAATANRHIFVDAGALETLRKTISPTAKPRDSKDVEALEEKCREIFNTMSLSSAGVTLRTFEASCKRDSISSTLARRMYSVLSK